MFASYLWRHISWLDFQFIDRNNKWMQIKSNWIHNKLFKGTTTTNIINSVRVEVFVLLRALMPCTHTHLNFSEQFAWKYVTISYIKLLLWKRMNLLVSNNRTTTKVWHLTSALQRRKKIHFHPNISTCCFVRSHFSSQKCEERYS